jgi:DNA-binding NarL/FixJ family response regulator
MIRVRIADDQALVRGGFDSILAGQDDIEVVGESAAGTRPSSWSNGCDPTSC